MVDTMAAMRIGCTLDHFVLGYRSALAAFGAALALFPFRDESEGDAEEHHA